MVSTPRNLREILGAVTKYELGGPLLALALLVAASSALSPRFLEPYNQRILLLQTAPLALIALGESMIILMGSIDLSPGSTMALAGVVSAAAFRVYGFQLHASLAIGVLVGLAVGAVNGLLVTKARIPSFVATLASLVAGRGLVLVLTEGQPIVGLSQYRVLTIELVGLPVMVWLFILFGAINYVLLKRTSVGLLTYAIGGNEEAVRYSGVRVDIVKLVNFSLAGGYYAIAGLMMNARLEVAYPWTGWGYELDAIASCVLGGIMLSGGVGNPLGPVVGAYMLTLLTNVLILLGVNPYLQWVVKGVVLVTAAVALTRGVRYVK
ncbi:MAG: ABC transporter permease [Sulfolobales archaeon]